MGKVTKPNAAPATGPNANAAIFLGFIISYHYSFIIIPTTF